MNERQSQLLKYIVEGYGRTAQPVGSKHIADSSALAVSPATIRNEMATLEETGYIMQPHTSAGRIPTIKGIEYYLQNLMELAGPSEDDIRHLARIFEQEGIRSVAKEVAARTKGAAIIVNGLNDYYYTGFAHLFSQPDFSNHLMVQAISRAVDQLDTVLPQFIADKPMREPKVYLGSTNPLGDACVAMFVGDGSHKLFGLLTPIRTDYAHNLSYLHTIADYL